MVSREEDIAYRKELVASYMDDVVSLAKYIPWLEQKSGKTVSETYNQNGLDESSIVFPVYDAMLLNFVKAAQKTKLLDRNYVYVYTRLRIKTVEDELAAIEKADIMQMDILKGILTKYINGGMRKGTVWTDGVKSGVFLKVVTKMKENLEYWDKPIHV